MRTKKNLIIPQDTYFYSIPLEKPTQRLTREMLDRHYPKVGRKAYMGNQYEYLSYLNGILTVRISLNGGTWNTLYFHVSTEELYVACSCGMPDNKFCRHAYLGLYCMMWRNYLDFGVYYWPGYTSDEKVQRKFLQVDAHKERITVEPKLRYGNIFRPDIGFTDNKHLHINEKSISVNEISGNREVIAFCLCYSYGSYYTAQLPIIIPCLGLTGKDDSQLVTFRQFGTKNKPINKVAYNSNQELLNELSIWQHEIARTYDELPNEEKHAKTSITKQSLFDLWQKAIPFLIHEKYCYLYWLGWIKFLNRAPRKKQARICRFSAEKPFLSFILKFHGDHFSLTAEVYVNGKRLEIDNWKPHFFLFDDESDLCYLMPSVQDDDLLMWVLSNNKRLTILNEHFVEFHGTFLNQVSNCYDVTFISSSGKMKKYIFNDVFEEISK